MLLNDRASMRPARRSLSVLNRAATRRTRCRYWAMGSAIEARAPTAARVQKRKPMEASAATAWACSAKGVKPSSVRAAAGLEAIHCRVAIRDGAACRKEKRGPANDGGPRDPGNEVRQPAGRLPTFFGLRVWETDEGLEVLDRFGGRLRRAEPLIGKGCAGQRQPRPGEGSLAAVIRRGGSYAPGCPRTPKCGAHWPPGTVAIRRKGPPC